MYEFETPHLCGMCGKKSARYYDSIRVAEGEPYRGNGVEVSRKRDPYLTRTVKEEVRVRFDFYRPHGYGAFCTLRCASKFANLAYKAGYRKK